METQDPTEIQQNIYKNMSCARKWAEACKLRSAAWELKAAGIRMQHPDWSEEQVQEKVKKIFLYATS